MDRRNFTLGLALAPFSAGLVNAADGPVAGVDYEVLQKQIPVAVAGKLEVIEFFAYWCPHCNVFEPKLEPWVKSLPADTMFRRIPVAWQDVHVTYQKLYFALDLMGLKGDIHPKVFKAFHEQNVRLEKADGLAALATAIGIDKTKLNDSMNSFTIANKIAVANQQAKTYQVEGVPTLIVNGKFTTSPGMAKSEEKALKVVDALLQQSRTKK